VAQDDRVIVIDRQLAIERQPLLLDRYRVPAACSSDLLVALPAVPAAPVPAAHQQPHVHHNGNGHGHGNGDGHLYSKPIERQRVPAVAAASDAQ
jgi:hypothetical protein